MTKETEGMFAAVEREFTCPCGDCDECERHAALATLRERFGELERLKRQATCVYCGHVAELESRGDLQRVMAEHIATCAKHPINRIVEITEPLEQQIATLTQERNKAREYGKKLEREVERWMQKARS